MAVKPTPSTQAKPPPDPNDLDWRLDEHERQLHQIEEGLKPEHVAAIAQGAVAALHLSMQAETEKLLKAVREDVHTDQEVVAAMRELCADIKSLILCLGAPVTRRSTMDLPSGPVTVTTTETR